PWPKSGGANRPTSAPTSSSPTPTQVRKRRTESWMRGVVVGMVAVRLLGGFLGGGDYVCLPFQCLHRRRADESPPAGPDAGGGVPRPAVRSHRPCRGGGVARHRTPLPGPRRRPRASARREGFGSRLFRRSGF